MHPPHPLPLRRLHLVGSLCREDTLDEWTLEKESKGIYHLTIYYLPFTIFTIFSQTFNFFLTLTFNP